MYGYGDGAYGTLPYGVPHEPMAATATATAKCVIGGQVIVVGQLVVLVPPS
jgi:uncharacterized RmlC-like cupin family protein